MAARRDRLDLHPDHWGQSLAHEALEAVVAATWARHPGLDTLNAEIDPRNTAPARLLARLGFREIHQAGNTVRVAREWCDSSCWRLERPGPPSAA